MAQIPEGKARGYWYVDKDVKKALEKRCFDEGKKESHVVEQALRVMLGLPDAAPAA